MKLYKVAAVIIIVHGIIGLLYALPIWLIDSAPSVFTHVIPPQEFEVVVGLIWGILKLISGIGLFKNFIWGYALSLMNCVIAIAMISQPPLGIIGSILWVVVSVLICRQCFVELKAAK